MRRTRADGRAVIAGDVGSPHQVKTGRRRWEGDAVNPQGPGTGVANMERLRSAIHAHLLGSKNSDDWTGKQIELYHDPNVSFGGEVLGGIRVRKARAKLAMPVKVAVEEELVGEPG